MPKRGKSRISIENLLSHSTEKLRRGTLLCSTKLLVSKKLMDKRGGGGREYHDFQSKSFLFHSAEKFRRGTLQSVTQIGYRKKLCLRGEYHNFLSKICCLTVPTNFVGESFSVSSISGIEKFYA